MWDIVGTYVWTVLQSFGISKLLRITVLTFLFVSNSLLNTGPVSVVNITLGHKHNDPTGATWIWKVHVNSPLPFRSQSTRSKDQIHDKSRCVWWNKDGKYESLSCIEKVDAWRKFKLHTVYLKDLDLRHRLNKMITVIGNASDVFYCWSTISQKLLEKLHKSLLFDDGQNSQIHNAEILKVKQMFLKHVQKVILELNEPRTLQGLLEDYKTILHNFHDSFKNKSNKIRLQQFLKAQFTAEAKTLDCDVIYSTQDECCSLVISQRNQRKKHLEYCYMEVDNNILHLC